MSAPWRIGHRGASGYAPENTLKSFQRAFALGADGIECDVHLCKSGEPVVIHDATLRRTTNGKGKVADYTLAELRKLDAGEGERIPTLMEVIKAAEGRMVFIEIKTMAAVEAVAETVTRFGDYKRLPVISFLWKALVETQRLNPHILIGATPPEKRVPLDFLKRAQATGMWSVNPCIKYVTPALVEAAHERGLKIVTWTANSPRQIAKAKALGVDGIISDYPDRLQ